MKGPHMRDTQDTEKLLRACDEMLEMHRRRGSEETPAARELERARKKWKRRVRRAEPQAASVEVA
jgi:hypothetical protein